MNRPPILFDDGAAYEAFMGKWSLLVGDGFLDWLAPTTGQRWVDVGCGNGAFTELLVHRCAAREVQGIDPSEPQLAFARQRLAGAPATFRIGDATALPYADAAFDAAVMALVIFFVPDPARGVAEMARVVRPGGSVSAYAWDVDGGGFPIAIMVEEMVALGSPPIGPPNPTAARRDVMQTLWRDAGLEAIETRVFTVERTFDDFATFWRIAQSGPRVAASLAAMPVADRAHLQERVLARMPADADGRLTVTASANAIKGRVPSR